MRPEERPEVPPPRFELQRVPAAALRGDEELRRVAVAGERSKQPAPGGAIDVVVARHHEEPFGRDARGREQIAEKDHDDLVLRVDAAVREVTRHEDQVEGRRHAVSRQHRDQPVEHAPLVVSLRR